MRTLHSPSAGTDLAAGDDADPDYLYFLEHLRVEGDSYVLEIPANGATPASVIKYEAPLGSYFGGEYICISDPSPDRLSTNRRTKDDESLLDDRPAWQGSLDDVDEDYRLFLQHTRLVDGQLVLEFGGVIVNYDQDQAPVAAGSQGDGEKDKQQCIAAAVASPGKGIGVEAGTDKQAPSGGPATVVPEQYGLDWHADPSPGSEVKEKDVGDEGLSDAVDAGTTKMKGVYWKASSSNGSRAGGRTDSGEKVDKELGIVWPTHITRRPDSDFKCRLIKDLMKPVDKEEYHKLFDTVTLRTPFMKLRQIRNEEKFYPTEKMGSSYLDHYPDLAEQIMNNDRRNGLALMRGFLFWLQNNAHDDQFRPWVDVFLLNQEVKEVILVED